MEEHVLALQECAAHASGDVCSLAKKFLNQFSDGWAAYVTASLDALEGIFAGAVTERDWLTWAVSEPDEVKIATMCGNPLHKFIGEVGDCVKRTIDQLGTVSR